jgi:hypothetical protein
MWASYVAKVTSSDGSNHLYDRHNLTTKSCACLLLLLLLYVQWQ